MKIMMSWIMEEMMSKTLIDEIDDLEKEQTKPENKEDSKSNQSQQQNSEQSKNIVDLYVSGDIDSVRYAVHKLFVKRVAELTSKAPKQNSDTK